MKPLHSKCTNIRQDNNTNLTVTLTVSQRGSPTNLSDQKPTITLAAAVNSLGQQASNFNINIYVIRCKKVIFWEFHMHHYLSVSQKQQNIVNWCLHVWQRLQSLRLRSISLKFSKKKNDSMKQLFKVLSLVVNMRPQPWPPLTDGLVTSTLCFSSGAALKTLFIRFC